METPRRRRPPARRGASSPTGSDAPAEPAPGARAGGFGPVRLIAGVGALVVAAVIAVAAATGTADDLPWGAIVGVVVILGAMVLTSRRRERRMRDAFPDDEDDA
jgi:LPXTG-motif cell wall-anchored protein